MPLPLVIISSFFYRLNSISHGIFDNLRRPHFYEGQRGLERAQSDYSLGRSILTELQRLAQEAEAGEFPETKAHIEHLISCLTPEVQRVKDILDNLGVDFSEAPSGL